MLFIFSELANCVRIIIEIEIYSEMNFWDFIFFNNNLNKIYKNDIILIMKKFISMVLILIDILNI